MRTRRLDGWLWFLPALGWVAFSPPPVQAQLTVDIFFEPIEDMFVYDVSVTNDGPTDVSLVTLTDAPIEEDLIGDTLIAPDGFLASYEPAFGFIDLIEGTDLFTVGTTQGLFQFQSAFSPDENFNAFQALAIDGTFITGQTNIIPEPSTAMIVIAATTMLCAARRKTLN